MRNVNRLIPFFLLLLYACSDKPCYIEFKHINPDGWHKDSVITFDANIQDTSKLYDILLHIRHTDQYPYQNMWLFIGDNDTIEFYLADDYGRWLGEKGMHFINMPVLYESGYHFDSVGICTFHIRHGMRRELLEGVSDVGVEITLSDQ